jgi:hypothetical protein
LHCVVTPLALGVVVAVHVAAFANGAVTTVLQATGFITLKVGPADAATALHVATPVGAPGTYWHCVVLPLALGEVVAVHVEAVFANAAVTTVLQATGFATVKVGPLDAATALHVATPVGAPAKYRHCVVLPPASGVVVAVHVAALANAAVTTVLQATALITLKFGELDGAAAVQELAGAVELAPY